MIRDTTFDAVFASTIQADGLKPFVDDSGEDTIERSFAEINQAICRSAARKA